MSVRVEVWGDYALFTRPEMKVERVSYDVMTPSAARGLLEAIYWHPGMRWIIDRIYVLNPIRFTNIRRNEVSATASAAKARTVMSGGDAELYICTQDCIQQRAAMVLQDVHYGAADWRKDNAIINHASVPGNSQRISVHGRAASRKQHTRTRIGSWALCFTIWTIPIPRIIARSSSGRHCTTGYWM